MMKSSDMYIDLFEFHGRNCKLFDRPTNLTSKMVTLRPNSLAD